MVCHSERSEEALKEKIKDYSRNESIGHSAPALPISRVASLGTTIRKKI